MHKILIKQVENCQPVYKYIPHILYKMKNRESKYLYIYHYDITCRNKTTKRQLFIRDNIKDYIDSIDVINITLDIIKKYDVVIIDYFVTPEYNEAPNLHIYFDIIKEAKNICFYFDDLHNHTFKYNVNFVFYNNESSGDESLNNFLKKHNIKNTITYVKCKEHETLINKLGDTIENNYVISHHIDTNHFFDHKQDKVYDILIYGCTLKTYYPLRHRLKELLLNNSDRFNVCYIPFDKPIRFTELSKMINSSWITVATKSIYDYLVLKYFEISGSKSVVAGDFPEQGKEIWNNNYIELSNSMTDDEILDKLEFYLNNKEKLVDITNNMYEVIHKNFTYKCYGKKLFSVCEHVNKNINFDVNKYMNNYEELIKECENL